MQMDMRGLSGVMKCSQLDCGGNNRTTLYTFARHLGTIHLQWVNFWYINYMSIQLLKI